MALWSNLAGTVLGYFRLGLTGVRLKNSAGELAVRTAGDTADAKVQIADGTAANHAVSKGQLDTKQPLDATLTAISDETLGAFSHRNKIINGGFAVNQRVYVSGAAVGALLYGHDRWKMAASADTYTFSTTANKTTVTIPAGKVLRQVIEGLNLQTGTYVLSWEGTAQGKIGAGSYGASGITGSITGGTNTTIEFNTGTVANVQLELGSVVTPFELRPIGTELALCQRYYEVGWGRSYGYSVASGLVGYVGSYFAVKRATPTIVLTNYFASNTTTQSMLDTNETSNFSAYRTTSATGPTNFIDIWTASAEL